MVPPSVSTTTIRRKIYQVSSIVKHAQSLVECAITIVKTPLKQTPTGICWERPSNRLRVIIYESLQIF